MTTKHFLSIPLPFCPCFYDFSLFHFTARFNSPPDTILYKTCPILPFSLHRKRNETGACREGVVPFGKQAAPSSLSKRRKQSDTPVFSIHLNSGKDFIRQRRMHERRMKLFSPEKNEKERKEKKGRALPDACRFDWHDRQSAEEKKIPEREKNRNDVCRRNSGLPHAKFPARRKFRPFVPTCPEENGQGNRHRRFQTPARPVFTGNGPVPDTSLPPAFSAAPVQS